MKAMFYTHTHPTELSRVWLQEAPERLTVAIASAAAFSLCPLAFLLLNSFIDKVNTQ